MNKTGSSDFITAKEMKELIGYSRSTIMKYAKEIAKENPHLFQYTSKCRYKMHINVGDMIVEKAKIRPHRRRNKIPKINKPKPGDINKINYTAQHVITKKERIRTISCMVVDLVKEILNYMEEK